MRNLLQSVVLLLLATLAVPGAFAQRGSVSPDGPRPFIVSSAHPNPFNATARFSVTVERTQDVTVEVYNMLGQKVQDLFQGRMMAGESRTFEIEARGLPAGLYLYRVQVAQEVVSRQVTLLR